MVPQIVEEKAQEVDLYADVDVDEILRGPTIGRNNLAHHSFTVEQIRRKDFCAFSDDDEAQNLRYAKMHAQLQDNIRFDRIN